MTKIEINCQMISNAFKKNESDFSNLLESQKTKKDSKKFKGYLIESRIIEEINKVISCDKSKNGFKDEKEKASKIKEIISSIKLAIFSSSSEFKNALKKEKKKFALIFNKELWSILSQNGKKNGTSFIFSINSRKELKIYSEEIKEPICFILNKGFIIDERNLIEYPEIIIDEILQRINEIEFDKEKKKYYIMGKTLYEKLIKIKEGKEKFNINELIKLNQNFKPTETLSKEKKQKKYYYDEFLLLNDEILRLLKKLGLNEKEFHPVECCTINQKKLKETDRILFLLIEDSKNDIKQFGTLNTKKIFKTNSLTDEKFEIEIKKNEDSKDIGDFSQNQTTLKDDNTLYKSVEEKIKENENEKMKDEIMKFQNGINVLLSIYIFEEKIKSFKNNKNNSDLNNLNKYKYYLISKKWIRNHKNFYLYVELKAILDTYFNINDLKDLSFEIKNIIFNNMFKKYKNEFEKNLKNNKNKYILFSDKEIYSIDKENQDEGIYIINEEILNNLKKDIKDQSKIKADEFIFKNTNGKLLIKSKNQEFIIPEENDELIDSFEQNQIRLLNEYFTLKDNIIQNIKNKQISTNTYYLINKEWMKKFEEYYSSKNKNSSKDKNKKNKEGKINYPQILENEDEFNCNSNDIININDKHFNFAKSFSLVNKSLFTDLCERKNKDFKCKPDKECIFNEGKIIIKNKKAEDSNYLIIGEYKNNEIMEIQGIMSFKKIDSSKNTFKILKKVSYSEFMKNKIIKDKIYSEDNKEIGDYFEINKEKKTLKSSKIIDFLEKLKAFYDTLKYKIHSSSTNQNDEKYYLINKRWLDEYKSFIEYEKFVKIIKKIQTNQNNNLNNQQFMEKFQNELEKKEDVFISKKNSPDKIDIKENIYIKTYNENFEIFSESMIDLLLSINPKIPKKEAYTEVNCYFSDQKLLIKFNENKFNICSFENNILENELILIKKEKCKTSIVDLFSTECFSYLLYNKEGVSDNDDFLILKLKPISNKLDIKNSELFFCIIAFINSILIRKKLESDIKNNYKSPDVKYEKYYIINYNNLIEYIKARGLFNIFSHLKTNEEEYQNVIFNNDYNLKEKINKIIPLINKDLIQEFKTTKKSEYDINKIIEFKKDSILIGEETIEFKNNFTILNEEAITFLNDSLFGIKSNKFLLGDNKLFLKLKKTIHIFNLDKNSLFNIDKILYIGNSKNSTSKSSKSKLSKKKIKTLLIENGYKQFTKRYFESINDFVSLIFLDKKECIGYCYNINSSVNDYDLYNINKDLKKMIIIYYFNESIKLLLKSKKYSENHFYLINQGYIEKYEKKYHFDKIEEELKKQSFITNLLKSKKDGNDYFNNDNVLLSENEIVLILKNLSEINIKLNKENIGTEIRNIYDQDEPNLINLDYNYDDKEETLFIYDKLRLIHKSIYISFFEEENIDKNIYTQCIFVDGLIFIKLSKYINPNIKDKIIYEIGALNKNNIFEQKYILICKKDDLDKLLKESKNNIADFFKDLNFRDENSIPLFYGKNQYGILINTEIKVKKQKIIEPIPKPKVIEDPPNIVKGIKEDFSSPPLIGLQNVGATCYMNATLQCFCQIEKLVNYFKYDNYINEVITKYKTNKEKCLTDSFKDLVENLWPSVLKYISTKYNHRNSNNAYFAPYLFKKKISEMNDLFKGAQANDSKDLVNFIVMTLHEELNRVQTKQISNNDNEIIDQTNPLIVFQYFLRNFNNENNSKISEIFYAINGTCSKCSKCNIPKYNFQAYFFLIFPLEEVRKFKINNLLNQFVLMNQNTMNLNPILYQQCLSNFKLSINNINSVNIYDCFEYNQKTDFFTGENAMFCNFCKEQLPSSYQTFLYTTPEILIIVLNRGKGIEFKIKLEFVEDLNLMNFVYNKQNIFYELIGVVTHLGESGASGHFISYCKSPIDRDWYCYNDDIVSKVKDFKKEIIDFAMPYILFFQKIYKKDKI